MKHFLKDSISTRAKPLAVAIVVVALAGVIALAARADVFSDLGLLPGGSLQILPAAQITDPPPQGSAKEPLFESDGFTCPTGAAATVGPFGYVVLNTEGPRNTLGEDSLVSAEVVVKNGDPDATYQIYLNQDPGGCPTVSSGTLTTNAQGNGNGHVQLSRVPGATSFWVSAFDPAGYPLLPASILRSPAATLN
jgi:hypothetical protein